MVTLTIHGVKVSVERALQFSEAAQKAGISNSYAMSRQTADTLRGVPTLRGRSDATRPNEDHAPRLL